MYFELTEPVALPISEPNSGTIRVLVVDDDPDTVELMVGLLQLEGFATLEAHCGEEALEVVRAEKPELVLLDVVLPDINGRDVCRAIKDDPDLAEVFVILVSGQEITRDKRIRGLESGADEYLHKPIQIAELVARIRSFVRMREAREGLKRANEELETRVQERIAELRSTNTDLKREVEDRTKAEKKLKIYARELRGLSRRLIETQELERRRIARELHDEAGQTLTVLKFVFNELEDMLPTEGLERLDDGQEALNKMVALVRNLYQEVRPSILDDLGLLPALLWQFDRYTLNTNVSVRFEHEGVDGRRFSPELETAAYRVAQESLTNIARHAQVKEAKVQVWTDGKKLHLRVEDQGKGFESVRKRYKTDGCGLLGMGERVQVLGGVFDIHSKPGDGTSVLADFPLQIPTHPVIGAFDIGEE
jgi:signal transduction histidine kinase